VLVRVELAAVDPVDLLVRSGAYRTPTPFPFVVGRDLVGTGAVAGPGAVGFAPGDRLWCNSLGHGGRQGACAEYAVVPAERCYHLPAGTDPVAVVALLHPAATAWLALGALNRLLAAGALPVRVHGVWPLDRVADAQRAVAAGVRGRIVLRVADPGS
jgi:NADPH:quinone reductase-like Zn-dependent oxidoreductase